MIKNKMARYALILFVALLIGRFAYKYTPWRIEFIGEHEKVWAHRVDSVEKLEAALKYFDGVELDLVYIPETKVLDVGHPPAPSIGLSFEKYLSAIPKEEYPFLWLDIKNLTLENANEILVKITALLHEKNYSFQNVLIESQKPESLNIFSDEGFNVSYYLPYGLGSKSPLELKENILEIQLALSNNQKLGVSSSYLDYPIISTYFPNRYKYLWKIDGLTINNYLQTRKILKDTTVKAVLSKFKSIKGNR